MSMVVEEPEEEYGYDVMENENGAPPIVPRGGGGRAPPPLAPRGGMVMSNEIYDDDDGSSAIGAITMDQIYVTDEIKTQPWFVGSIDRAESERLLKQGDRLGNFLVREKVKNKSFVHSYMSLTRMTIIHNMVEFARDGSCKVDNAAWQHGATPSLEDVIDKMQEIRRSRKNMKASADPGVMRSVTGIWAKVCPSGLTLAEAKARVQGMRLSSFLVCTDATAGPKGYIIVINNGGGVHKSMCPRSAQGQYLKYSELSASTMVDLVAMILSNEDAARASGVPRMAIPSVSELDAPAPTLPKRGAPQPPSDDGPAPPPRPAPGGRGKLPPPPPVDDIYGDGDEPIEDEDIYDD